MKNRLRWRVLIGVALAFTLVAAACGDADDDTAGEVTDTAPTGEVAMPGEGVSVNMARANWNTGYFQAAIYRSLLEELGYEVTDPADSELEPATFYPALARGEFDFWVNGWFPIHQPSLDGELPDGSMIGEHVTPVGFQVEAGALQGYLIDKATADAEGITHVDQINDDPELAALFDTDGDGAANLAGCNEGWGCADTINETIELNEWSNIQHVQGSYSALFIDVVDRYEEGEPIFYYTWTPNFTVAQLVPGEDVVWLGVENPPPDNQGVADLGDDCAADPCQMGFVPADIRVVANNDFLAENPAAEALFEAVVIPAQDIYDQNLAMNEGAGSQADIDAAADEWIEENRSLVDTWLDAARAAA